MFSSRLESGFRVVVCFTILYMVMTRKMRLSCQNRETAPLTWTKTGRVGGAGLREREKLFNCL